MRRSVSVGFGLSLLALAACDEADGPLPRIESFMVQPARVSPGDNVTLTWEVRDAPGVLISPRVGVGAPVGVAYDRPYVSTTYQLSIPDGSGLVAEASVEVLGAPRVLAFEAQPRSIFADEPTRLIWKTEDATEVEITPELGARAANGELELKPSTTTTYRLTAKRGPLSSSPSEVTVVVVGGNAPRITGLTASPQSIRAGESFTLKWSTEAATEVVFDQGIGSVGASGTLDLSPDRSTSYTLSAAGPGGTTQGSVTVQVLTDGSPRILSFDASPDRIAAGGTAELRWEAENAEGVRIDPDLGGQPLKGSLRVAPAQTTSYVLTAFGSQGSVQAQTEVTVVPAEAPVILAFEARPSAIYSGSDTELSWQTQTATAVSISGVQGSLGPSGSVRVSPTASRSYVLTAYANGQRAQRELSVEVQRAPPSVVRFEAMPTSITAGNATTLSWEATDADSVEILPGVGTFGASGQTQATPASTQSYTLIATNTSGTARAELRVNVQAPGAPTITQFGASPVQLRPGQSSQLSWSVSGATSVSIDNGIGAVAASDTLAVSPAADTTYTLTAVGAGGTTTAQATVRVVPLTGDSCAEAFPITASGTYTGDTRTATDVYRDVSVCTGHTQNGPDIAYRVPLSAGDRIRASLRPTSGTHDQSLYLLSACTTPSSSCVTGSDSGTPETIDYTTPYAGDFFLIVDGFGAAAGPYTLEVDLNPAPIVNDTCGGAIDVTAGGTFAGDTTHAAHDYSPVNAARTRSCTGYEAAGPDLAYVVTLSAGERLEASLDAAWDGALYLTESCATAGDSCVAGSDSGNPEQIDFTAARAGTYHLIVDGYGSASGSFQLSVQVSPPASGGDTCQGPVAVPSPGAGYQSTTTGMQNVYAAPSCLPAQPGADRVYSLAVEEGDVVLAVARFPSGFDGSVYVLDDCAAERCLVGSDQGGSGANEAVGYVSRATASHFVVVDAPSAGSSDHELVVARYRGETCSEAIPLLPGATWWTTTAGRSDDYAPSTCVGTAPTGADRAFAIDVGAGQQLDARLRRLSGDPALYVLTSCGNASASCLAGSDLSGSSDEHVAPVFTADTSVYVIVDSASGAVEGELSHTLRGGDTCSDPYVIPSTGGTFEGTTAGFGADVGITSNTGSCTRYSQTGADAIYQVEIPAGAQLTASVSTTWDAALYLASTCATADATCVAGDDSGNPESLTYRNTSGSAQTYFLVVDSWRPSNTTVTREGSYTLDVSIQ